MADRYDINLDEKYGQLTVIDIADEAAQTPVVVQPDAHARE